MDDPVRSLRRWSWASVTRVRQVDKSYTFPLCNRLKWRSDRHLMSRGSRVPTMPVAPGPMGIVGQERAPCTSGARSPCSTTGSYFFGDFGRFRRRLRLFGCRAFTSARAVCKPLETHAPPQGPAGHPDSARTGATIAIGLAGRSPDAAPFVGRSRMRRRLDPGPLCSGRSRRGRVAARLWFGVRMRPATR